MTMLKITLVRLLTILVMIVGLLLTNSRPVQAASGYDVVLLTLPAGVDVRPDFDPRFTMIDRNGAIYIWSARLDNSARGVYRVIGNNVEPFLIQGEQVPAQTLNGIGTLVTIDHVLPNFVDAAGRAYFFNQRNTEEGQLTQLLRLETGGGLTLLDSATRSLGSEDYTIPSQVLSDGRWLRYVSRKIEEEWFFGFERTDGTSTQQLGLYPSYTSTCIDGIESEEWVLSMQTNVEGKVVIATTSSRQAFEQNDCTRPESSAVITQALRTAGGDVIAQTVSSSPGCETPIAAIMQYHWKMNDAGQILYTVGYDGCDTDTYQLFRDNQMIHTLTIENATDEVVESSFQDVELLPDGSVIYAIPAGVSQAHPAGGLFRDGEIIIAGNDPLFSAPVNFERTGLVNSDGAVIVAWRLVTDNDLQQAGIDGKAENVNSASMQTPAQNGFGYVLLSKAQGRWTNAGGGDWGVASNWAGEEIPGQGNGALFNLANEYTVNLGTHQVGSAEVRDGDVTWAQGTLDIIGELAVGSVAEQGTTMLMIREQATVNVGEVTVGVLPLVENEIVSVIQIFQTGVLNVSGTLVLGDAAGGGIGLIGGTLVTGETRLGVGSPGHVGALGGQWNSGNLLIGEAYPSSILNLGASLQSDTVRIGGGMIAEEFTPAEDGNAYSSVTIDGITLENEPVSWSIAQALEIGSGHAGHLQIVGGASVQVAEAVMIDNVAATEEDGEASFVLVSGVEEESQHASTWLIGQDLLVGNAAGGDAEVRINAGGIVDVGGTLSVGHQPGAFPLVIVENAGSSLTAGQAENATCTIGFSGSGTLIVREGGNFHCHAPLYVGLGEEGAILQVADVTSRVQTARLEVGAPVASDPTGNGLVVLGGGQLILDEPSTVWENGTISGNGSVSGELTVLGEILIPLQAPGPSAARVAGTNVAAMDATPGNLQINGGLNLGPSSQLQIELVGREAYGQLHVTGTARLDGTLVLAFGEGYAPRAGDEFRFIDAENASGAFTAVTVTGLADGWQYALATDAGITTLTSTNDGIATTEASATNVFLPMVSTR